MAGRGPAWPIAPGGAAQHPPDGRRPVARSRVHRDQPDRGRPPADRRRPGQGRGHRATDRHPRPAVRRERPTRIVHVKIWATDGTVLCSGRPELRLTFLGANDEITEAIAGRSTASSIEDANRSEAATSDLPPGTKVKRLRAAAGTQLDPRLVASFVTGIETAIDPPMPGDGRPSRRCWPPTSSVA